LDARLTTLLLKKYSCEIHRSENWIENLTEPSKEGYGSKRAVLPMLLLMLLLMMIHFDVITFTSSLSIDELFSGFLKQKLDLFPSCFMASQSSLNLFNYYNNINRRVNIIKLVDIRVSQFNYLSIILSYRVISETKIKRQGVRDTPRNYSQLLADV
jgi:hypothetical protein